jgi:hypothetical protein
LKKSTSLPSFEFLRRFSQHNLFRLFEILPPRFVRIRHYGILGNYKRKERLKAILKLFKVPKHPEKLKVPTNIQNLLRFGRSQILCPKCKKANLVLTQIVLPNTRDGPSKAIVSQCFSGLN